jgi:tRNA pseudouridine38-40 synthase
MRYKATVIYDGTNYCGWQIQDDKPTVQQEIEKALKK